MSISWDAFASKNIQIGIWTHVPAWKDASAYTNKSTYETTSTLTDEQMHLY